VQEEKTRFKEIYLGTAHYKLHHIVVEKRCMQQAYLSTSACGLASWLTAYLVVFLHLRMNPKNDRSSHLTTSRAPISYTSQSNSIQGSQHFTWWLRSLSYWFHILYRYYLLHVDIICDIDKSLSVHKETLISNILWLIKNLNLHFIKSLIVIFFVPLLRVSFQCLFAFTLHVFTFNLMEYSWLSLIFTSLSSILKVDFLIMKQFSTQISKYLI